MSSISLQPVEVDDAGTPPAVTEAGFERKTLVLRDMCLTHSTTWSQARRWSSVVF